MSEDKPLNVHEALLRVSEAVDYIAKEKSGQGISYKYRGIEQVLAACQKPFIDNGIVIVPSIVSADTVRHEGMGKDGKRIDIEVRMLVNYKVFGPGGKNDFIEGSVYVTHMGQGGSDKSTGSAMSYAYKNFMFQLLCIPTAAEEDNDDVTARQRPQMPDNWPALASRIKSLDADVKDAVLAQFINLGYFKKTAEGRVPADAFTREDIDVMDRMINEQLHGRRPVPDYEPEETPSEGVTFGEVAGLRSVPDPIADGEVIEVVGEQAVAVDLLSAVNTSHPQHAIDTMAEALNNDNPDVTNPAMWALAEYYDPDEIIWWPLAKPFGYKSLNGLIKKAKEVAALHKLPEPNHVNDIHGLLATELRLCLLKDAAEEEPF